MFMILLNGMIFSYFVVNELKGLGLEHKHDEVTGLQQQSDPDVYHINDINPVITRFGSIVGKFVDYGNISVPPMIKYGESKICIVSAFVNYPINISHRILNHQQYAKLWGYSYFYIDNETQLNNLPHLYCPNWYKPWIIKELLKTNKFEYVLWIDSDAVFMNCQISLTFIIKNVINLLHEKKYNFYIDYSMLISPDINHMNDGVLLFKNNEWCIKLMNLWIATYYQLVAAGLPSYYMDKYAWGGDNGALVMLLHGYDPNTMNFSEKMVSKHVRKHWIMGEHIDVVKDLQYNQFLLHKSFQNDVGLIPQSFFNSFERESNTHFLLHCAGSALCKNLLPLIIPTSSCSKSNILYLNEKENVEAIDFDDEFLKAFCTFNSYQIEKCIDRILAIFENIEKYKLYDNNKNDGDLKYYHIFYGNNNKITDDLILFILSFLATQKSINSKLIIWKMGDNDIITFGNIKNILLNQVNMECILKIESRIEIKIFNINLWQQISNNYNLDNDKIDLCINNNGKHINYISDFVRFVVLYHFGGIWFDIDNILLKDYSILYDKEYLYPFTFWQHVNTAVLSLRKYHKNGIIDGLLTNLFKRTLKKEHKKITCDVFKSLNLIKSINLNDEPNLKIYPLYLFDPTWYRRDIQGNTNIINQNNLKYPYWLPSPPKNNGSYFMYINEKIDDYSWNKINKNINNYLPYSMSNHYHPEVLRNSNITKGSWLDIYRKEYISRIQNDLIC